MDTTQTGAFMITRTSNMMIMINEGMAIISSIMVTKEVPAVKINEIQIHTTVTTSVSSNNR